MNSKLLFLGALVLALAVRSRGLNFSNDTPTLSSPLNAVAYGGVSNFVAAGASSKTWVANFSGDGLPWTGTNVSAAADLFAATYANGMFVVGGDNGRIFSSLNGLAWSNRPIAFANQNRVTGLAFNGGHFVAIGTLINISWADSAITTWTPATILNPVSIEGYRGVTAFGANSFAVCGIRGLIRLSTDGGATWTTAPGHSFTLTEPDLLGIASDGNQTLVCVGTLGRIMVSINGGVAWTNVISLAPGLTTLNAVTYTGSGFIAAGNGGLILTSSDGGTWTAQTSPTTSDFLGISFATSNELRGVGVLVGKAGRAVIAGTPPPRPINAVGQTNCANALPNMPLSVSVVTNTDFPSGTVAVDWYATDGITRVATNSSSYTPTDTAAGSYTYFAEERDLRTGFVSTNRTSVISQIDPRPLDPVNPVNATNCAGVLPNPALSVTPAGTGVNGGTVVIDWYANSSGGTPLRTSTSSFVPGDTAPGPHTYYAEARVVETGCVSTNRTAVTLTLDPVPLAPTSPTGATNCAGVLPNPALRVAPDSTGITGTVVVDWYANPAGGTALSNSTSSFVPGDTAPGPHTYYAEARVVETGCISTSRTAVTLTLDPVPLAPTSPTGATNCAGVLPNPPLRVAPDSTGITGTVVVDWYANASGGTALSNATSSFVAGDIVPGPHTYFAEARVVETGCISTNRTAVTLVLNPVPLAPTNPVNATNCAGVLPNPALLVTPVTSGVNGGTVVVDWYAAASGGTALSNATSSFVPGDIAAGSHTYYAEGRVVETGCISTNRTAVTLLLNPVPLAPINPVNATNCAGVLPNPALTVTPVTSGVNGGTVVVDWYAAASGGTALTTGTSFFPVDTAPGSHTYYAEDRVAETGCISTNRTAVTLLLNPVPLAPSNPVNATNCAGVLPNPILTVTPVVSGVNGGTVVVDWYANATGGLPLVTATNGFLPADTAPGLHTYYAEDRVLETGCISINRTAVILTLNPVPLAPTNPVNATNCAGVLPNPPLTVTPVTTGVNGGTVVVDWYANATGGVPLTNGTSAFIPPDTTAGSHVYYTEDRVVETGCISTSRTAVTLVLNPVPLPPVSPVNATNCAGVSPNPAVSVTPDSTGVSGTVVIDWYDAASNGNKLASATNSFVATNAIPGSYTYYAEAHVVETTCVSANRTAVTLTLQDCSGPLTISLDLLTTNVTVKWFGNWRLQESLDVVDTNAWITVTNGVVGVTNSFTEPATNNAAFFRARP